MKRLVFLLLITSSVFTQASDEVNHFWPKIPFNIEGANLCNFRQAYSQSRSDYMMEMTSLAERLLYASEVYDPAQMHTQNLVYAKRGLGATLESSFKAYLDSYYRDLKPRVRKIEFKYLDRVATVLNQSGTVSRTDISKIDLMAYGTYSMSPDCRGGVLVTLTIIKRDGTSSEYIAKGPASTVMSQIASRVFEDFQRTKFPTTVRVGNRNLEVLGGLTGDIGTVVRPDEATLACQTLGARLPNESEYKILNTYGSWSGGITLSHFDWVLPYNQLLNLTHYYHVRSYQTGVNGNFKYICVR